ncbi:hypothetical protein FIE12Z_2895 [Fusarium flagelliforme]|uniref:Uncharacterized protein n=1 Tax=Fusarium flagelliforme TaxID=2675880 RepID=A0A395MY90_9HYPO|nr:hypothetical protein FIE12Z_2895 [Fusarium flagelliforme]
MAPTVQKDASGNTVCRHRTSMCKPSHTEGVQVIEGVGRKQGTKNRRKNGRSAANMVEILVQRARERALGSDDEISVHSLQSLPQMQAAFSSGESTPQSAQVPQFPTQCQTQPNWVAPVPAVGPYPHMQVNQPAGNFGAAPGQPQQKEMAQQLAELGVWHDPMLQMQAYQHFGYPEPDFGQLMQMQEAQRLADIQGRGFTVQGQRVTQPLIPSSGTAMNGVPPHQNMAPSQHPVQPPEVDYLTDHDQFNKIFPLTQETLDWGTGLLQELEQEKGLQ